MDYMAAFAISATGMNVERTRLEVTALNIANANTTRVAGGALYKPLRVIVSPMQGGERFSSLMNAGQLPYGYGGVSVAEIRQMEIPPRLVYEPTHPDADERGFVAYPAVNPVSEMINLTSAIRAYEANVVAANAAKAMALKALEIGRG